jgi:hypothetical protein
MVRSGRTPYPPRLLQYQRAHGTRLAAHQQSLVASMIAVDGEKATIETLRGWAANADIYAKRRRAARHVGRRPPRPRRRQPLPTGAAARGAARRADRVVGGCRLQRPRVGECGCRRPHGRRRRSVSDMNRLLIGVGSTYLLFAIIGRFVEGMGAVQCQCAPECWCQRPLLSVFRWVFPFAHRSNNQERRISPVPV